MNRFRVRLLFALLFTLSTVACGGGGAATPVPTAEPTALPTATQATLPPTQPAPTATVEPTQAPVGIEVVEATFAHGLSEEMEPVEPGSDFYPDETVYLSVRIKGRPEEGQVTARFYWYDTMIAEASVDLAEANSGVLFSVGEDTYAGYTLTHEEPFYVGRSYRADVSYGDEPLGTWSFGVVPPADAIATKLTAVTLARGADENYNPVEPATAFTSAEEVFLVGHGDLGLSTWMQAEWYVGGTLDPAGTRSFTLQENAADVGFAFSYLPEGGWPAGEQYVVLTVDGEEFGRYSFTISQ